MNRLNVCNRTPNMPLQQSVAISAQPQTLERALSATVAELVLGLSPWAIQRLLLRRVCWHQRLPSTTQLGQF